MTSPATSILERRRDQMSPELDPLEIERMRRFGETRNFAQGEVIVTAGEVGPGFVVILSGEIASPRSLARSVLALLGHKKTVRRAERCSALVLRGYVDVGAAEDDTGADLAWGYVPGTPASDEA